MLWARVTIAANPDSTMLRLIDGLIQAGSIAPCLFEGYLADGESLMLELLEAERLEVTEKRERLYTHLFEGPIDGWLGSHKSTRSRGGFRLQFTIEDMTEPQLVGAD
jgi:hypothetical protein